MDISIQIYRERAGFYVAGREREGGIKVREGWRVYFSRFWEREMVGFYG